MVKKRITYIDLFKAIAIFMVITLHAGTWQTGFMETGRWTNAVQFCARTFCEGVPIFMLINGFLIFKRPFDVKKHVKRTLSIVAIIIIWSVIMEVYFTLMNGAPLTFGSILKSVLNTNISNPNTGVLWFLQKLVVVYLLFPVLKFIFDSETRLFDYLLLAVMVSTFGINIVSLAVQIWPNEWIKSVSFFLQQYSLTVGVNVYVLYFMLGGYLCKNIEKIPKIKYIIIGIVSALVSWAIGIGISFKNGTTYSANYNFSQVFLMFVSVGMLLLLSYIPLQNRFVSGLLASIGDNTMGIYLIHRMVIFAVTRFTGISMASQPFVLRFAIAIAVFIISWLITLVIRKIPKVSFIVKI